MPSIRDRASDALLRVATTNAIDRQQLARELDSVPASARGREMAVGAVAFAGWVDSAMLWLSWRLRPSRLLG